MLGAIFEGAATTTERLLHALLTKRAPAGATLSRSKDILSFLQDVRRRNGDSGQEGRHCCQSEPLNTEVSPPVAHARGSVTGCELVREPEEQDA